MGKSRREPEESSPDLGVALGDGLQFPVALQHQIVTQMRLRESGIPPKYMAKELDAFTARDKVRKQLIEAAESYVSSFNLKDRNRHLGLFFQARTGAGKTHLAVSILKGVIQKGYTGCYANVPRLLEIMRDLMFDRAEYDDGGFLARCETADLLVLDDLGAETVTGWVQDRLYLLINRRYEDMGRTIVTTNCNEATLRERVGERVESRLIEMCNNRWVFPHEDFRMKTWGKLK